MRIELHFGDITDLNIDCIVNAARPSLLGGGGVDGAVHQKAGHELKNYCSNLGGCKVGDAKLTPGFGLKAKYIIHTVGPRYLFQNEEEKQALAACYISSLNIAKENHFDTIAFPNISTGAYGFPKEIAASIAFESVFNFIRENELPAKVIFCCFEIENLELYTNAYKNTVKKLAAL